MGRQFGGACLVTSYISVCVCFVNLGISFFKECQHFGVQVFLTGPRVPMDLTHLFPLSHFYNMCLSLGGSYQGLSDLFILSKDLLFVSVAKLSLALFFLTLSHKSIEAGTLCYLCFCMCAHHDCIISMLVRLLIYRCKN